MKNYFLQNNIDMLCIPSLTSSGDIGFRKKYETEIIQKIIKNYHDSAHTIYIEILNSLDKKGYLLNKEIPINIKLEGGEFLAEYTPLNILEYSEDYTSVLNIVKDYIVYLYDDLTTTKNANLSPNLVSQKKLLKQLITRV